MIEETLLHYKIIEELEESEPAFRNLTQQLRDKL